MTMKTSSRQVDGITVVDLGGQITLDEGSIALRDTVKELLAEGHNRLLLNFGNVTHVDSSGIGELVRAFTSVHSAGGDLKLLNLTQKVQDLLQITKLHIVFDVWDDETSAIHSFSNVA